MTGTDPGYKPSFLARYVLIPALSAVMAFSAGCAIDKMPETQQINHQRATVVDELAEYGNTWEFQKKRGFAGQPAVNPQLE